MDEGVFKTARAGLIGSRRTDTQWLWQIEARAKRMEAVCKGIKSIKPEKSPQLTLPTLRQRGRQ